MMIHDFDMARFLVDSEVVEVFARGAVRVNQSLGPAAGRSLAEHRPVRIDEVERR